MFRIGEFSRLGRVSIRMLRYYDQLGLLKPLHTDRLTGYRSYSADQLPRLNRILALQELGFSLEQITDLLDENLAVDELRGMLKLKRAEVQREIEIQQARLASLEARLRQMDTGGEGMSYDVVVRSIDSQLVATQRGVAADDERIQYMFEDVEAHIAGYDEARADKPPLTIYHDPGYRDHHIDAEVAVPIKFRIPGSDAIQVRELAGLPRAACVVHTGDYATLYQAYNALMSWVEVNQCRMAGSIREVYLRYGADGLGFELPPSYAAVGAQQYVTELQLPVGKS